jgi:hypothetical protein
MAPPRLAGWLIQVRALTSRRGVSEAIASFTECGDPPLFGEDSLFQLGGIHDGDDRPVPVADD